jgi:hypothetical protein
MTDPGYLAPSQEYNYSEAHDVFVDGLAVVGENRAGTESTSGTFSKQRKKLWFVV